MKSAHDEKISRWDESGPGFLLTLFVSAARSIYAYLLDHRLPIAFLEAQLATVFNPGHITNILNSSKAVPAIAADTLETILQTNGGLLSVAWRL